MQIAKFTLGNCLFGTVKLTKNADPDKYGYSGHGVQRDTGPQTKLDPSSPKYF